MRESAKGERTHLPGDTYQEWLKSQKEKPAERARGRAAAGNSFEIWMAKRVEERTRRTTGRAASKSD